MFIKIKSLFKSFLSLLFGSKPSQRRDIFVYWNGERTCKVDPLLILYRMQQVQDEFNLSRDGHALDQGDIETTKRVADAMFDVFEVKPIQCDEHGNETGLTSSEVNELLRNFILFQEELKKNSKNSQTLQQSTVAAST